MSTVSKGISETSNTWVAISKKNIRLEKTLFNKGQCENESVQEIKNLVEKKIIAKCTVLTVVQRCADWFFLPNL